MAMNKSKIIQVVLALIILSSVLVSLAQSVNISSVSLDKSAYSTTDTMYITVTYVVGSDPEEPPSTIYTTATVTVQALLNDNLLDQDTMITSFTPPGGVVDTFTLTGTISTPIGQYPLTISAIATFVYRTYDLIKNTIMTFYNYDTDVYTTIVTVTTTEVTENITTETPIVQTSTTTTTEITINGKTTTTYTITTWTHRPPHSVAEVVYYTPPELKIAVTSILMVSAVVIALLLIRRYVY